MFAIISSFSPITTFASSKLELKEIRIGDSLENVTKLCIFEKGLFKDIKPRYYINDDGIKTMSCDYKFDNKIVNIFVTLNEHNRIESFDIWSIPSDYDEVRKVLTKKFGKPQYSNRNTRYFNYNNQTTVILTHVWVDKKHMTH